MVEIIGLIATVLAVWGVVLNNRKRRECFLLWLVSNSVTLGIHAWAGIWSLAVRDLIFLALAVEGYWLWMTKHNEADDDPIVREQIVRRFVDLHKERAHLKARILALTEQVQDLHDELASKDGD